MSNVLDLFLKYAAIDTKSNPSKEGETARPSSPGQITLKNMIIEDLKKGGVKEEQILNFADGSFLVRFPAAPGKEKALHACFAAHLDTHPDAPGGAVTIIHENYQGNDIRLPKGENVVIPADDLKEKIGKTIVTASGDTTLGADDKSGVAILVATALELAQGKYEHGSIDFWFCTDEEVGQLDVKVLPADLVKSWNILITVDGGDPREIDVGCFCGWETIVEFLEESAHPGVNGAKLKPAHYAACALVSGLTKTKYKVPWTSSGHESFIYVAAMEGNNPSYAKALCIPRSFDKDELPKMEAKIKELAAKAAKKFRVQVKFSGQGLMYINTRVPIEANRQLLEPILQTHKDAGYEVKEQDVRGGTDGAMINIAYSELPAPNIATGGYNLHGPREFLIVEEMEDMFTVVQNIIMKYADM